VSALPREIQLLASFQDKLPEGCLKKEQAEENILCPQRIRSLTAKISCIGTLHVLALRERSRGSRGNGEAREEKLF
jgi:hypothetical protein